MLLLRANYAPGEFWFAGQRIPLEPGQLIDGEENIAKLAGVSRKVARTAIDRLTKGGFLDRRPAHPAGQCPYIITIKDYAHLLFNEPQEGPPNGQPQGDDGAKNGPTTGLEGAPSEQGNKGKPGEPLNNEPQLTPDPLDSISGA